MRLSYWRKLLNKCHNFVYNVRKITYLNTDEQDQNKKSSPAVRL